MAADMLRAQFPAARQVFSARQAPRVRSARLAVVAGATDPQAVSRREQLGAATLGLAALASAAVAPQPAEAIELGFKKDLTNKRKQRIPESEYTEGLEGLKYYDVTLGNGTEAKFGDRVVVHFEAKWKGVTFVTSRQGLGVTGGSPLGFDMGAPPGQGGTLKGLDLGVRGMKVGGRRKLIVPPNLAYGKKGFGEIPPDATLDMDVELLSVKLDSRGFQVKIVEG